MKGKKLDTYKVKSGDLPRFKMRLFVAGSEPNSKQAAETLARFCERHLANRYEYDIVDVFENYQTAIEKKILAVPALLIEEPPPERIIIGSLRDDNHLLNILGISSAEI